MLRSFGRIFPDVNMPISRDVPTASRIPCRQNHLKSVSI